MNGRTIRPEIYLIIAWPRMAGQTGPKTSRTKIREIPAEKPILKGDTIKEQDLSSKAERNSTETGM